MDVELARTFLEIVTSGSFARAAERLNVGQTTVVRASNLETAGLHLRAHQSDATLTPAASNSWLCADVVQLWSGTIIKLLSLPFIARCHVGSESVWNLSY